MIPIAERVQNVTRLLAKKAAGPTLAGVIILFPPSCNTSRSVEHSDQTMSPQNSAEKNYANDKGFTPKLYPIYQDQPLPRKVIDVSPKRE